VSLAEPELNDQKKWLFRPNNLPLKQLTRASVLSPKYEVLCRRSVGCFSRRERSAHICVIRVERATRKNSLLAPARRVAMKMGRRLCCSSVTYRFRYAPLAPVRLGPPCRRPILIATKYLVFRGHRTRVRAGREIKTKNACPDIKIDLYLLR
jgi:hypothetical protein